MANPPGMIKDVAEEAQMAFKLERRGMPRRGIQQLAGVRDYNDSCRPLGIAPVVRRHYSAAIGQAVSCSQIEGGNAVRMSMKA